MPKSKHRKKHKKKLKARKSQRKKSNNYSSQELKAGSLSLIIGSILNG